MNSSFIYQFNKMNVDSLEFAIIFFITAYGLFNFLKKIKALHHETERVNPPSSLHISFCTSSLDKTAYRYRARI